MNSSCPRRYLYGKKYWLCVLAAVRPKFAIPSPKQEDELPRHFYMGFPPPSDAGKKWAPGIT